MPVTDPGGHNVSSDGAVLFEDSNFSNRERLELVVRAAGVGVWDCDLIENTVWWNEQYDTLFGPRPRETAGSWDWWTSRIHPEDRDRVRSSIQSAIDDGETNWCENYRFQSPRGHYLHITDNGLVTRDDSGRAIRILGAMQDVTALENARLDLKKENVRKDEFLATLSHELRSPLVPLQATSDILVNEGSDTPRLLELGAMMSEQVRHLTRLVDDLLDISRVNAGQITLAREPIELSTIVNEAVAMASPLCTQHRQELLVRLPDRPIKLNGDRTRLVQVLNNLLQNAIHNTPAGGRIEIDGRVQGATLHLMVRDNGRGILDEEIQYIFDQFVRFRDATNREERGLGLGLALTRSLLTLHGGDVSVSSRGLGQGSEFLIKLPVTPDAEPAPILPRAAPGSRRNLRVLVVDDESVIVRSMEMLLQAMGHTVWTADGGENALEVAFECRPDTILVDLGMPGIDGYEVARRVRKHPVLCDVLLVAVSGHLGYDGPDRIAREAGFDRCLAKPPTIEQLQSVLELVEQRPD